MAAPRLGGDKRFEQMVINERRVALVSVAIAVGLLVLRGHVYATTAAGKAGDVPAVSESEESGRNAVKAANEVLAKAANSKQQMLKLPIRVVDPNGKPVAMAKVTPWALRSSQGHGLWEKDKRTDVGPEPVVTDDDGKAAVLYPKYESASEKISTIGVSVNVDHPGFAYDDAEHIDVPLETKEAYEIKLKPGVDVEVRPLLDGKPAPVDGLYAVWSDGRSCKPDVAPEKTSNGGLRFRGMAPGKNSILLVKLDGERATYFSKITDFELKVGEQTTLDVPLEPSMQIHGKLSDNVPRPIRQGFIKTWSLELPREEAGDRRVTWMSWSPVQADGTFTIDGWPAHECVEIIALCDEYMAKSGNAPDTVKDPPDPEHDFFRRAQVFAPDAKQPIELEMTPMARCDVTAVDEAGAPVAGVKVESCPNVQWWNSGSQIYCWPLERGEKLLRERDYQKSIDELYAPPFEGVTDAIGKVTIELPEGREDLGVGSDVYELPVFLGSRTVRLNPTPDKTNEVTLNLQPRGTEKLGDWDKLAGVVFGCSTRAGRRICALPEVRKKMDEFEARFRDGKSQHDPQLLSEAYTMVADAFVGVGDKEEAAKWRAKAAVEAAKVKK